MNYHRIHRIQKYYLLSTLRELYLTSVVRRSSAVYYHLTTASNSDCVYLLLTLVDAVAWGCVRWLLAIVDARTEDVK